MELVSIGRGQKTIDLYDTPGGKVTVYASMTVDQQDALTTKYGHNPSEDKQASIAKDTIVNCFVEWNVGKDGQVLECTPENLAKFTMRDFFAILQACTGRKLLDEKGNMLTIDEIIKKGKSE